jgi:hypothetical protein
MSIGRSQGVLAAGAGVAYRQIPMTRLEARERETPALTAESEKPLRGRILVAFPRADCPSSILVRALIDERRAGRVYWITGAPQTGDRDLAGLPLVDYRIDPFRSFRALNALLYRIGAYHAVQGLVFRKRIEQCAAELETVVERVQPDAVWGLAHLFNVPIVDALLERVGLPLHLSVHDEPIAHMQASSPWPHTPARLVAEGCDKLFARAASIDTISVGMRDHVRQRWGRGSVVIPPSPRLPLTADPPNSSMSPLRIGLSGCWAGFDTSLACLRDGLQQVQRRKLASTSQIVWVDGQSALRQAGVCKLFGAAPAETIKFLPRLPEAQAVDALAQCSVLYLPFWHDDALTRQTANPSKLCIYLPASRPIIIHGPEDSVAVRFAREHGIGTVWNTLDPHDFPAVLEQALSELDDWAGMRARYQALLDGALSLAQNRQRLWNVMDATLRGERQP